MIWRLNYNRVFFLISAVVFTVFLSSCKKESSGTEPQVYGRLSGNVTDVANGQNMAMVNVYTVPATSFITTDINGAYTIENILPGAYKVFAAKNNYDTISVDVTVNAGSITYANFILKPYTPSDKNYGIISGILRELKTDDPISKAFLYTVPSTSVVTTNSTGEYEITNVPAGKYKLWYGKDGYDTLSVDVSVIAGKTTGADLTLAKMDTSAAGSFGKITGRITNATTGLPISGAAITSVPPLGSITTSSTGDYEINNIKPGSYKLKISKTGFTDKEVDVVITAGTTVTVNASLQLQTGNITGRVIDAQTGNALAGVNIKTTPGTSSISTGSDGRYDLQNIIPGKYKISAVKTGYTTLEFEITVTAGLNTYADFVLNATP